ncbi:MAG: hypothetical protein WCA96_11045, partial [Methylocella sp.]
RTARLSSIPYDNFKETQDILIAGLPGLLSPCYMAIRQIERFYLSFEPLCALKRAGRKVRFGAAETDFREVKSNEYSVYPVLFGRSPSTRL